MNKISKNIGFAIAALSMSVVAAAEHLATCKVEYYTNNTTVSTAIEIPKSTLGDSDLGYYTQLYSKDGKNYYFVSTYSNKLNNAVISVGRQQGAGLMFLLHTAADLNVSPLTLNDMENQVYITCQK